MGWGAAVDVAIGLVLMYLVLSLVVTVLNETIATAADLRSSNLRGAITSLIDDPTLRIAFYDHGLISGINGASSDQKSLLSRAVAYLYHLITRTRAPNDQSHVSYISGQIFARALLGSVDVTKALPTFNDIKTAIEHMTDSNARDALLAQLTTANGDLQLLHENVAAWFDNAMDRVSGVYKRHLKGISFVVALGLVVVVNADTLKVGRLLWDDASLRAVMVQTAVTLASTDPQQPGATPSVGAIKNAEENLRPLPLGWSRSSVPVELSWPLLWIVVMKLVGLILTAIAISLGAPFWFDVLSMFMNVRGTGEKPEKTSAT
jgi:hypothetical protein